MTILSDEEYISQSIKAISEGVVTQKQMRIILLSLNKARDIEAENKKGMMGHVRLAQDAFNDICKRASNNQKKCLVIELDFNEMDILKTFCELHVLQLKSFNAFKYAENRRAA
jgi:hypothetical protein